MKNMPGETGGLLGTKNLSIGTERFIGFIQNRRNLFKGISGRLETDDLVETGELF